MLLTIILLTIRCSTLLLDVFALWRYTPLNRVQKNLFFVLLIWFMLFLSAEVDHIKQYYANESPLPGLINFGAIWRATIGIVSLAYLISTVLYAKQREVIKALAWGIPLLGTFITYIIWCLATNTPLNQVYTSIQSVWANRMTFPVLLRLLMVIQIMWILISITSSVWKLIPLYNKYSEDNYADSAYNIDWVKTAVRCTFIISMFYLFMIFPANSFILRSEERIVGKEC